MTVPNQGGAPAAPAAPQQTQFVGEEANDQRIGDFAKGLLQDFDENPDTEQLDSHEEPPQEAETPVEEVEAPEPEAETPPQDPTFDYDLDGETIKVSEKLKGRLMADKDYRQKTMALADQRRNFEALTAKATQVAQQAQQLAPYYAQLQGAQSRVEQLSRALQSPELAQDPVTFNRVQGELSLALYGRDQLAAGLQQQTQKLQSEQQTLREQQLAADAPRLFEEVPALSKPEARAAVAQYAQSSGLPQEAIDFLNYSAVGTKLVWKASQYDQMVRDQEAAKTKLQEKVKGLPSAAQSSRAAPQRSAQTQQLQKQWQSNGGKINDPAFDQLLRARLRG